MVEISFCVALLAVLVLAATMTWHGLQEDAKAVRVKKDLIGLRERIRIYKATHNQPFRSLSQLPGGKEPIRDPWGTPYLLDLGRNLLLSVGPDSLPSTDDVTCAFAPLPVRATDRPYTDFTPPEVVSVRPRNGEETCHLCPTMKAEFWDTQSGVDWEKAQLALDGKTISGLGLYRCCLSIMYAPSMPLKPGCHSVKVVIVDRMGNVTRRGWSFFIRASEFER